MASGGPAPLARMYREQLCRRARSVGTVGLLPGLNGCSFETEEYTGACTYKKKLYTYAAYRCVSMIFFGFIFETQHTRHRCHRTTTRQILHTLASPPNILSHPGPTLNSSHFSSTKGRHLSFIAMMAIRTGSYLCAAARASTLVGSTWSSAEARTRSEALLRRSHDFRRA